jgi:hypothetical protein
MCGQRWNNLFFSAVRRHARQLSNSVDTMMLSPQQQQQQGVPVFATKAIVRPRKILSDVDDTLLCSAGHFPAGIDQVCRC